MIKFTPVNVNYQTTAFKSKDSSGDDSLAGKKKLEVKTEGHSCKGKGKNKCECKHEEEISKLREEFNKYKEASESKLKAVVSRFNDFIDKYNMHNHWEVGQRTPNESFTAKGLYF